MKSYECVPNFSEGRDEARIERIVAPARAVPGVAVLDVERDADHNRCVVSIAGPEGPLVEAVLAMMAVATREIDLNHHRGEHPRMGATDVVPFVPLGDATMEDAIGLAGRLAERVWTDLHVPVYLYGSAARRPERQDLGVVRKGEFEGIRDSIASDPARNPDVGDPRVHPTAGIVAIGARPLLIAYNAYLSTNDVQVAKKVAHAVRTRDGGLPEIKALGFEIKERGRAQVSMNLTDYRRTSVPRALEAVRREAARYGAAIEESEIVGLVPADALLDAAEFYLQLHRFSRDQILDRKLDAARAGAPPREPSGSFADLTLREFSDRVAARTPTPGGGSAAAVAAAFGAALGEMVIAYSLPAAGGEGPLVAARSDLAAARTKFLALADEDSRAYDAVRTSRKSLKATPQDVVAQGAWERALRGAAEIPMTTARETIRVIRLLEQHRAATKTALASDLVSAIALLRAAREAALSNVTINLEDLRNAGHPIGDLAAERDRLRGETA
jgi:glutamate formiminotransferase / formiminotetrahydrofolate cyclodeaminase